jgi:hypothetical protein
MLRIRSGMAGTSPAMMIVGQENRWKFGRLALREA